MTQPPKALLFGAIGTLTETSELQRESFNAAFESCGLNWHWDLDAYRDMVERPGGKARIAAQAREKGVSVDVDAIYDEKVAQFRARAQQGLSLRPGVADLTQEAKRRGIKVGFVTATGARTVDLIRDGLKGAFDFDVFSFVSHRGLIDQAKPDPEVYALALRDLGVAARDAVAIEDTPESAVAAIKAGIACVGFPGALHQGRDFPGVLRVVDRLDRDIFDDLGAVAAE